MRLLLDTHVLIWFFSKQSLLPLKIRELILDPVNEKFLSIASVWEMAIKSGQGKLKLPVSPRDLVTEFQGAGGLILPITLDHAWATENLPWHHRDPFDRLLIAQAAFEKLTLVSHDGQFDNYTVSRLWQLRAE
ncbi:MAG: type II toxin-antitoxin system VapC family toxin [Candidatus Adiutrix sp.]|jgi:PIN domain nuclease of toxin-antitoxin system|nr:type II toxin-antitoxin system VapC family toxin [Candidatus Adiutrix sp.]